MYWHHCARLCHSLMAIFFVFTVIWGAKLYHFFMRTKHFVRKEYYMMLNC